MRVVTLRALADNYVFVLEDEGGASAAVVDPGDARPVLAHLQRGSRRLRAILLTHFHSDHVGGVRGLLEEFPGVPVIAGADEKGRVPGQTNRVTDGDEVVAAGARARVLEVPGHTRGHVAYFFPDDAGDGGDLFSGDTIFGGTVGNLFEGTPEVMFQSVRKIRALPLGTRIWCGHEYTLQYVREAARLDPGNARLAERRRRLEAASRTTPTVPLLLEEERATNPFFRWDDEALAAHLGTPPGEATFRRLCDIT
ncbi:MAG: hydroxyacylglutathione hydrolase [Deltaproteobacteria bacterium]|nr:hydroxyacylglutathione hydrolase [Deltaproteobacteria bacterium]